MYTTHVHNTKSCVFSENPEGVACVSVVHVKAAQMAIPTCFNDGNALRSGAADERIAHKILCPLRIAKDELCEGIKKSALAWTTTTMKISVYTILE